MADLIRSVDDLPETIDEGTAFFVDVWPVDPVDDPAEIERYEKLDAEILQAIADRTIVAEPGDTLFVDFADKHVLITSTVDATVKVAGDVRDGIVRLKAGKPSKRALSKEGNGFVSVDDERFYY